MLGKSRRGQGEIRTLLGQGTRIVGDVIFDSGLHLDGRVEGSVVAVPGTPAVVTVGTHGSVQGNVEAPEVIVEGSVEGNVFASERVVLGPTACVVGNVVYKLIEMAGGAEVNGKLVHRDEGSVDLDPAD